MLDEDLNSVQKYTNPDDYLEQYHVRKRRGRKEFLRAVGFGAGFLLLMAGVLKECTEANSMDDNNGSIDSIVEQAACGFNGQLHYQRPLEKGDIGFDKGYRGYCLVNGDNCPFYQKKGVYEYCHAPFKTYEGNPSQSKIGKGD